MYYTLSFILFFGLPLCALGCKSTAPEPSCPEGYWEIPDGWKIYLFLNVTYDSTYTCGKDCIKNYKCLNYKYLCNGERDLMRDGPLTAFDYSNGSPDENICSDEFCSSLPDGRTKRCPGTTRCIEPTVTYFKGTNIPIGPICAGVTNFKHLKISIITKQHINLHLYMNILYVFRNFLTNLKQSS